MQQIQLRPPIDTDGYRVFELIAQCPPLDTNSAYCNLLQCSHFSDTSVIALHGEKVVGFISGYITPQNPDTLFIWQVAVDKEARGKGLAKLMLKHVISRESCAQIEYLNTTITPENKASWSLFESFAKDFSAPLERSEFFSREQHFAGHHETELLAHIGPLDRRHTSNSPT